MYELFRQITATLLHKFKKKDKIIIPPTSRIKYRLLYHPCEAGNKKRPLAFVVVLGEYALIGLILKIVKCTLS